MEGGDDRGYHIILLVVWECLVFLFLATLSIHISMKNTEETCRITSHTQNDYLLTYMELQHRETKQKNRNVFYI